MARDVGGIWCAAKVIDVSDSPEGRRLKIHFKGFGARHDEWITLGTGRLRPPPGIECSVGDSYEACDRNGKWCEAKVVEIEDAPDGRRLKVHFMGFGAKHDEWITLGTERLRPLSFGTNVAVGGRVHARDKLGIWAEGKVLEVRENRGSSRCTSSGLNPASMSGSRWAQVDCYRHVTGQGGSQGTGEGSRWRDNWGHLGAILTEARFIGGARCSSA